MKKGDKVKITSGRYEGQTATVTSLMVNGAMVERDVEETRRFCPVMFEHLDLLPPQSNEGTKCNHVFENDGKINTVNICVKCGMRGSIGFDS